MMELAGKVALVSGGSRGIGAAVARRLAREGAAVALSYATSADKAQVVANEIAAAGRPVRVIQADHANPRAAADAVEQTVQELGRLDILVNNAGIFAGGPLEDTTTEDLDRILAVDVKAVFLASQAAARYMGDGGRIINIGSALADRVPGPTLTLYSMSKAALVGLTKGLARDLGPRGIRATLIHAGAIDTDMNPENGPAGDLLRSVTALGHYGAPEDIAALVAYLAGDGGRYVTGTAITIDGGLAA
ncbi:MAG: 3-oxoacyl-[acyl-carrier protein] reductase [Actinomycetota bacterium]|jgi:NAD(P)-dependent dehydrogenase (short-subunit alcohol dehydrogenase family)|nr:3-oxoacyl-[acyl-carrier protein] reductase [Actinomycetota bacterium]